MSRSFDACLLGAREARPLIVPPVLVSSEPLSSALLTPLTGRLLMLSALDFLPPALGLRFIPDLSVNPGGINVPGPTDFLGAFVVVPALLNELGGKWLCLLPRSPDCVLPVIDAEPPEFLDAVDAVEFFLAIGTVPCPLREGTGMAGCGAGFLPSESVSDDGGFLMEVPLRGSGKLFRLGSVPTIVSWKSSKLKVGSRKLPKSRDPSPSSCADGLACMDAKLKREMSLMDNSRV